MTGGGFHLVERAVNTVADLEILFEGLEVNVACLGVHRAVEDQVDVADDGGGVGLRGHRGGVQLLLGLDRLDLGLSQLLENIVHRCLFRAVMSGDQLLHLGAGSHHLDDLAVQREAEVVKCLGVEGVAEGDREDVSRGGEGDGLMESRHARRHEVEERGDGLEAGKVNRVDAQFGGDDLGKLLGGHDRLLDHDLVDFAARVERFLQKLLCGHVVDGSRALEDVDDLMWIHAIVTLSGRCPPSCWR